MLVQIVMATYNGEKYIEKQIESIISQTITDWSLLIHDDGSTDETIKIIKHYEKKDSRIHLLDDNILFKNSSANFIHLIRNSDDSAKYLSLCDQDDVCFPNKLEI